MLNNLGKRIVSVEFDGFLFRRKLNLVIVIWVAWFIIKRAFRLPMSNESFDVITRIIRTRLNSGNERLKDGSFFVCGKRKTLPRKAFQRSSSASRLDDNEREYRCKHKSFKRIALKNSKASGGWKIATKLPQKAFKAQDEVAAFQFPVKAFAPLSAIKASLDMFTCCESHQQLVYHCDNHESSRELFLYIHFSTLLLFPSLPAWIIQACWSNVNQYRSSSAHNSFSLCRSPWNSMLRSYLLISRDS